MGQVRRDHLPSLQSFLTEERHANLLRLIPPVVITPNRTLVSTKARTLIRLESPRRGASRGRTRQPYSSLRGRVTGRSYLGVCCCGQDRAGPHPVSTGVFRAIPGSSECEQLPSLTS